MLAVVADRIGARRIDDDRAIVAELFLQARMTVIPVGPRLDDRKFVDEFRTRLDSGEADARHAVHLERQDQAVPMDRTVLVEVIYDGELRSLSVLEAYQRRRQCAVAPNRSEGHTSELQSLRPQSNAVFCWKKND